MKIEFEYEGKTASFPADAVKKLGRASTVALKLLILLAADEKLCENFSPEEAAKLLKCEASEVSAALSFWDGAGIVNLDGEESSADEVVAEMPMQPETEASAKPAEKKSAKLMRAAGVPEYTSEELAEMLESNVGAISFVDEAQRRLGKMLNHREVSILVGLRSYLELEDEYLLILLDHCAKMEKTSMRYVETVAFGMYDEGITDPEALSQRLLEREAYSAVENKFKMMTGARGRRLSAKETRFLNRWTAEMKYPFEIIELAYDITVDAQHEYNPAYMNGILERWFASGITTLEEAEATRSRSESKGDFASSSFNTNDFFEAALRRSFEDGNT